MAIDCILHDVFSKVDSHDKKLLKLQSKHVKDGLQNKEIKFLVGNIIILFYIVSFQLYIFLTIIEP